ncbi:hypothetical protein [Spirillospora sp. NPDC029432]|uniref:hypothetical protein n=1 Tax=Spirillospora sp. NPDC029432 TaxID=3154599 RepID=UPI0034511AD6
MRDRRSHGWPVPVAAMLAAAALGGCGEPAAPGARPSAPDARPAPPRFDPPVRFDPAGRPLPTAAAPGDGNPVVPGAAGPAPAAGRAALVEATVYTAAAGALTAVPVAAGAPAWSVSPRTPGMRQGDTGRPLAATLGGRPVVLAAFPVTVPAEGGGAGRPGVELVAAARDTGRVVLDDVQVLPDLGADTALWNDGLTATVVAADDTAAVIRLDRGVSAPGVLVTDPAARRVRWFARDLVPELVADGLVIGRGTARRIASRTVAWRVPAGTAAAAAPGVVAIGGRTTIDDPDGPDPEVESVRIVQAATGKAAPGWPRSVEHATTCAYDARSVTICHGGTEVSAYEAATGRRLWRLPAGGREAPRVGAVWHGAVYGTLSGGPVVLDARTGRVREAAPGVRPIAVGPYGALALDDRDRPRFHPATG